MQLFRKSFAALLTLVFVFFSLVTFTVYAFNNTFLKPAFYVNALQEGGYDFIVNSSAKNIYKSDEVISRYFTETDLKREISNVFTKDLFKTMVENFAGEIEKIKNNPGEPLTISLKLFRESLLTLSNNLAYGIFKNIPECKDNTVPEQTVEGLPTCIPGGIDYSLISAPITKKLEKSIYSNVPEQMQFDLNSSKGGNSMSPADLIKSIMGLKTVLYVILVILAVLIAFLIYRPFSLIILYEGIAFFIGGLIGYLISFGLEGLPKLILSGVNLKGQDAEVLQFMNYLVSLFSQESQKMALIFLGFGALLIVVQLFIKRNAE